MQQKNLKKIYNKASDHKKLYEIKEDNFTKNRIKVSKDDFQNFSEFKFEKIFEENSGQNEIFDEMCVPILNESLESNKSALIFTYGISNSGKTHSIVGNFYFILFFYFI